MNNFADFIKTEKVTDSTSYRFETQMSRSFVIKDTGDKHTITVTLGRSASSIKEAEAACKKAMVAYLKDCRDAYNEMYQEAVDDLLK